MSWTIMSQRIENVGKNVLMLIFVEKNGNFNEILYGILEKLRI